MALNLSKLLPSNLRNIPRYKDIIDVYQSVLYNDIKPEIERFITRTDITRVTDADAKLLIADFGHKLSEGTGYTSTSRYFRKELRSIVNRIKIKGTEKSYLYILSVFDLIGDVYPTIYNPVLDNLSPWLDWSTSTETDGDSIQLDTDYTLDQTVGSNVWTLDSGDFISLTTRHFIFTYQPNFIENVDEFMSVETAAALYNDVVQNKRQIEIPHFEFTLTATSVGVNNETIVTWETPT